MFRIFAFSLCTLLVLSPSVAAAPTQLVDENPATIKQVHPGVYLVDFGRVAFGNIALTAPAGTRSRVTVHFGEALSNGRIDRNPPGSVRYKETRATLDRGGTKVVAPRADKRNTSGGRSDTPPAILTPEQWDVLIPFRWIEIEGWPGPLQQDHIVRRAAYSSTWDDNGAAFHSSDEMLNHIWELSRYTIKATSFAGVYVDGDRERIPYEGDAYLNQLSHYYTDSDKRMARDTFDHLLRHPTWPTEWSSHMVFMAYADWMHTGDLQWLQAQYEPLKQKLLSERAGTDSLVTSNPEQIRKGDLVDWPQTERDDYVFTPVNTVVNAFHLRSIELMGQLADALDRESDARQFADSYNVTRKAFQQKLFNERTGLYLDGVGTKHSSLHANLFPLAFGLAPVEHREAIADWLSNRGMRCSVYAAQYLLEGIFENGAADRAIDLITAADDRSWRHMVESGATITWEAWDVKYKPNLDWNHAWGAAPANLLPRYVLGVQPLAPGWSSASIAPAPGNLAFARGSVPTPHGPVLVDWQVSDTFTLVLEIPRGMNARVALPAAPGSKGVSLNGVPVRATRRGDRWLIEDDLTGRSTLEVLPAP